MTARAGSWFKVLGSRSRFVVLLCAFLAFVSSVEAHEIGTTQVSAVFPGDGSYQLNVVVDPDALLTRLQILAGEEPRTETGRVARDQQIAALDKTFLKAVRLKFDGQLVTPAFEYRPVSAFSDMVQTPAVVRLTGRVPEQSQAYTLSYGLGTGTFALVTRVGETTGETIWLEGGEESQSVSLTMPTPPTVAETATRYFGLGFTHILPNGLDHILFVLGLFLLSTRWRSVLLQVSTFTVAHSITLGLTIYGIVSVPAQVVEPMIALSIAYVAIENILTAELKSWRLALVFSFGLLHGMGFAGVLRDLGLPRGDFLTALLTFNVGVEAGQLAVVALALLIVSSVRKNPVSYRRLVTQPASVAIALTGVYWTVERLL